MSFHEMPLTKEKAEEAAKKAAAAAAMAAIGNNRSRVRVPSEDVSKERAENAKKIHGQDHNCSRFHAQLRTPRLT